MSAPHVRQQNLFHAATLCANLCTLGSRGTVHEENSLPRCHVARWLYRRPHGEADWIVNDPEVDFAELWAQFDTLLMGRVTYDAAVSRLGEAAFKGPRVVVASRTLQPTDHPGITIIHDVNQAELQALRTRPTGAHLD